MKIVVCGGGTAGWLAALMIKKIQPDHDVTVIESSKIGIVGAGEGSTGFLTDIIQNRSWDYGCNEADFLRETNATVKLGIKHRDWKTVGNTYYGPIDGTPSSGDVDSMLLYALATDKTIHTASRNGALIDKNSSSFFTKEYIKEQREKDPHVFLDTGSHAYHFDAHLVGQYFKKIVTAAGATHIDDEIVDVVVNEHGIDKLTLASGNSLSADFYVDCTGFARKLATALDINWNSYKDNLPVNAAMPFLVPHKENEIIEPVTTAHALSSGWMWQIPVQNRKGCGYVFDDRFITPDQAQQEIEKTLGHSIDPIRVLKFDTGKLEKLWHKNCLVLGLAAAFAEPLEATSIHSTIVQLQAFIFDFLKDTKEDTVNLGSQMIYNKRMTHMYDDFKDFLVLHYQTKRDDSEFWRWINTGETRTEFVNAALEIAKVRLMKPSDFTAFYGYAGASLWNWVLIGLGHVDKSVAEKELAFWNVDRSIVELQYKWHEEAVEHHTLHTINNTTFVRNIKDYI